MVTSEPAPIPTIVAHPVIPSWELDLLGSAFHNLREDRSPSNVLDTLCVADFAVPEPDAYDPLVEQARLAVEAEYPAPA